MRNHKIFRCVPLLLIWVTAILGCTGHLLPESPSARKTESQYAVITEATPQDTMAALARRYLGDEDKAWQIAAYNGTDTLEKGQRVVIPLVPTNIGGLRPHGYRVIPVILYTRLAHQPTNAHTVSVKQFKRHIQYLVDNGFNTVSLDWLHRFFDFKEPPPPKAMVVSFDTSQRWVYNLAYPILKQQGMKGALFIRVREIGRKGNLTWQQISEMASNGFDIGTHGIKIDILEDKNLKGHLKALEEGVTMPKKMFHQHLGSTCRYYAYSNGLDNDLIIAFLKKHGYRSAFTRIRGANPFFAHQFRIKRSLIYGQYSMEKFRNNLITFRKANLQ